MEQQVKIGNEMVTPLLLVDEAKPIVQRMIWGLVSLIIAFLVAFYVITPGGFTIADIILIIVLTLYGFFWASGRNKYYLLKEGVGFSGRGGKVHRWDTFTGFTVDDNGKKFRLNQDKSYLVLQTVKHFDEAKDIITKNVKNK